MRALLLAIFIFGSSWTATAIHAHDLDVKYGSEVKDEHKKVLENVLTEVAALLPQKFKNKLPPVIEIQVANQGKGLVIPQELCAKKDGEEKKAKRFIYGSYNHLKNLLLINEPVVEELKKGRANSKRINCQHKSLYDQAIATIIHELTHAYDLNNGRISNTMEYIRRAGFKKGLLRIKNKNIQAMRSADPYELSNITESFAVNMEYFAMDPEFMCRKPSMFDYFKRQFGEDPYPNRKCTVNNAVLMSTQAGFIPVELDISRVYRIDYLQASAGKEIMSGFGHSMFRIVMCAPERVDSITKQVIPATPFGKKCLDDKFYHLVVSYRANIEDAKLNYFKGFFGGYPSMLFILGFSDVLDEYNRDELRDIMSYPLKLTAKEKEDFITKVKEEHWNYRGSYKFVNNNCATESYDLLKAAIEREELNKRSSVSPNGVLDDLDKMQFLSKDDGEVEIFKAQTEQIVLAYEKAYNYRRKNETSDKKAAAKFIDESTTVQRLKRFQEFKNASIERGELNQEVNLLKNHLVAASSFSVMEQQILRTKALKFRKKIADQILNSDDPKMKELVELTKKTVGKGISEVSKTGYGIPLEQEMQSRDSFDSLVKEAKGVTDEIDKAFRMAFPDDYTVIDQISKNISTFNSYSLAIRKEYRAKLDQYVKLVLKNLSHEDFTKSILVEARNGDKESLKKVRELMGKDLINATEILDSKLKKMIDEII